MVPDRPSANDSLREHLEFVVPGIHCAGCIGKIERAVESRPDVSSARVNFSSKRLIVYPEDDAIDLPSVVRTVEELGYDIQPWETLATTADGTRDQVGRELTLSLAVAGFAAGNVMLLSVSVWSGASDSTRELFHWLSALIALPAIVYAGRPFFRSAFRALKARSLNMDVPISLAVILAASMSLYETITGGAHAWFDAAITLLFFLLIGRVLDHMVRDRARNAVSLLLARTPRAARVVAADGAVQWLPIDKIQRGTHVRVAAGEQIPVDGEIIDGESELESALIDGESLPRAARRSDTVYAGTTNLSAPLTIKVLAVGDKTYLAEIVRLMEAAERGKSAYLRIADRAARLYTPLVHILAAAAFIGWWAATGDPHRALLVAIAVLIITCPCALGIAVPVVQVVASGLLFRKGILVKEGSALERIARIDTIIFDKTGTLTMGKAVLQNWEEADEQSLAIALALANSSNHPLSRALSEEGNNRNLVPAPVADIQEIPGAGLEGRLGSRPVRLGRRDWCAPETVSEPGTGMEIVLARDGEEPVSLRFHDRLRPNACSAVQALKEMGLNIEILSGDRAAIVKRVAGELDIQSWRSEQSPGDKTRVINGLRNSGANILVVGDGLNDGPALASGNVSMAPSTASDLGRTEADIVFTGDSLMAVADCVRIGRASLRHVHQNFALAIAYNLISVPVALAGLATPLIAALAMSSSSITVTLNALRLKLIRLNERQGARS